MAIGTAALGEAFTAGACLELTGVAHWHKLLRIRVHRRFRVRGFEVLASSLVMHPHVGLQTATPRSWR